MAFGETNGPKPARLDIKALKELPVNERPKPDAWSKELERAQRDELNDLKRATQKTRAERTAENVRLAVSKSIELASRLAEMAIRHGPVEAKESAERLRALAKEIVSTSPAGPPQDEQPPRVDNLPGIVRDAGGKAARYKKLEDRLRQRDRANPKPRDLGPERER